MPTLADAREGKLIKTSANISDAEHAEIMRMAVAKGWIGAEEFQMLNESVPPTPR